FTSNNGGPHGRDLGAAVHTAEPGNTYTDPATAITYYGVQDSDNAAYEDGRRYLPSLLDALVLKDAYGYSITPPETIGTFYANLDRATSNLLVRGGDGNDTITVRSSDTQLTVSVEVGDPVPGTGPTTALVSTFNLD